LAYYVHRAISVVMLPVFGTPKPIARAPTRADIIRTPSPNGCRAFAYGVMQAIIQGRPKGWEVIGKKNTLIIIITRISIKFVPLTTCITNYVLMRLPSGARIKRDNIRSGSETDWIWEAGTRTKRAGRVILHILHHKALPLFGERRYMGSCN
jgi:hypothetical protein